MTKEDLSTIHIVNSGTGWTLSSLNAKKKSVVICDKKGQPLEFKTFADLLEFISSGSEDEKNKSLHETLLNKTMDKNCQVLKDENDIQKALPTRLATIYSLFRSELTPILGKEPIKLHRVCLSLITKLAYEAGGVSLYLPRGDKLERVFRNSEIKTKFNGRNIQELALNYNLSHQSIYNILKAK